MQLSTLQEMLSQTPVMLIAEPALLAYLPPNVEVLPDAEALVARLDNPYPQPVIPMLTFDANQKFLSRIPLVQCPFDPYTEALNTVLGSRYDTVAQYTLKQSDIADRIVQASAPCDIVVLLLIDGLSYRDARHWPEQLPYPATVVPCLAEGPTITRFCFPTIIGTPPLAAQLFDRGFAERIGLSYWHREDNKLTNRLFETFHQVHRCHTMRDVIAYLSLHLPMLRHKQVYVQIVRVGLDASAHHQRELPPIDGILEHILAGIKSLSQVLEQQERPARLYVTSDHGILWRDECVPEVIGEAQGNARMAHWRDLGQQRENGLRFDVHGDVHYALPYPMVRRRLRSDEAGIHGGVSFQESLVPFLSIEVNVCSTLEEI